MVGIVAAFVFGAIIGSFLSVVVYRLPKGQTIVFGHSQCPHCHHQLGPIDLIPLISFLIHKGNCRYCHKKVSFIYPAIELTTGLLFVIAYGQAFGGSLATSTFPSVIFFSYLAILYSIFVALFYIDLLELLLPDTLVFSALLVTILYHSYVVLTQPLSYDQLMMIVYGYIFGLALAVSFLLLIVATRGKGMGGGDMKFVLVLGAAAGWPNAIAALFLAFVSGAIISLGLIALGKKHFKAVIPFGPFLLAGTVTAMVYGRQLVDFYLNYLLR